MKITSIFIFIIGILWDLFLVLAIFIMMGIAAPISTLYTGAYFLGQFIGPLALIVGSTLTLSGSNTRLGAILVVFGCLILTAIIAYTCVESFMVEPLQAKPPYGIYAIILVITIMVDIGGFILYRMARSGRHR
jgi:hypothetical protein